MLGKAFSLAALVSCAYAQISNSETSSLLNETDTNGSDVVLDADALQFGMPCYKLIHDRSTCDCENEDCYQSWISSDPNGFKGTSGQCRCLSEAQKQPGSAYTYGLTAQWMWEGQCRKQCKECRFSWPSDDPLQWKSDSLQARCMPALSVPEDPSWDYNNKDFADPYADWQPEPGYVGSNTCLNLND